MKGQREHKFILDEVDPERWELVDLRWNDPAFVGAIARGGGPKSDRDYWHLYCPRCSCNKSGHVDEPNASTEACTDSNCRCHQEES